MKQNIELNAVASSFVEREAEIAAMPRQAKIDQMVRSFEAMDNWVKNSLIHAMGAPKVNKHTGKPWASFQELLEAAADDTINQVYLDTEDNGDLVP